MKKYYALITLLIISNLVNAAPQRFDFTFSENLGSATATGFVVFENTLLANPGGNTYTLPDPLIIDLQVTVAGTAGGTGDGVFTLNDFAGVVFNTGGIALDFSTELVGQPTDSLPWGSTGQGGKLLENKGGAGPDFNLFAIQQPPAKSKNSDLYNKPPTFLGLSAAPDGIGPFTLGASSGEAMAIVSFAPFAATSVPSLSTYSNVLFGTLLLLIGFLTLRKL